MSGSTARSDLVGPGISVDCPLAPGFEQAPVTFVVDGARVRPRMLKHRWDPDYTETVYALTDALRLTERKGLRGAVLCADWSYEGAGEVEVRGASRDGIRHSLGGGRAAVGSLVDRPFADWRASHAPRLQTASRELAEIYAYRWFLVYRDAPGELALQLRESRWMRAPTGVQAKLDAWSGGGDPYTPSIEFAEHHRLSLARARDTALAYVVGRGGFDALPPGLEEAVWHWGMVRSLGGPDLRDAFLRAHPEFTSPLPFLLDDFGARERAAMRAPATPWELHALARVAASTRDSALVARFAGAWTAWTAAQLARQTDAFDSAWLDTFFRAVVVDGLVDVGPLRLDGVPWKEDEISLERDGPGGPARVTGSRRNSQPR